MLSAVAQDRSLVVAAGGDATVTVFTRSIGRFRRAWSERRAANVRRRLIDSILPAYYNHGLPTWLSGTTVADLSVPATYLPLRAERSLTKAAMQSGDPLQDSDLLHGYRGSGQSLLVLGQAGAGKTWSLFALLRTLVTEAASDAAQPVPFYLNLSGWDGPTGDFGHWCTRAIAEQYAVPHDLVERWLHEVDLSLVLDGLDELPLRRRSACISRINKFTQEHGQISLVVACRTDEYLSSRGRLRLRGCQHILPIDTASLLDTLTEIDDHHVGLRQKALDDGKLRQLLRTPLFLQLGLVAYRAIPAEMIVQREGSWQSSIITAYFEQAEERVAQQARRVDIGVNSWLPRLAARLRVDHRSTFYPDRLPIYLLDKEGRRRTKLYTAAAAVVLTVALMLLVRGPLLFLASDSEVFTPYASTAALGVVLGSLLSWQAARKAFDRPPTSRRTLFKKKLKRAAIAWWFGYCGVGALAWLLPGSSLGATVLFLASILVAVLPSFGLMRGTESREPDDLPKYPGHETRNLLICSLTAAGVVAAVISVTLALALGPMNSAAQVTPLPTAAMLPYFAIVFAAPTGLINGGAELLSRIVARLLLARSGLLPKRFTASFHQLQRSSILVQSLGGYEFIHVLVRDELVHRLAADRSLKVVRESRASRSALLDEGNDS